MKKRGTRLVIVLCALALQSAAVYKLLETDRKLAEARLGLAGVNDQAERVARLLAELRALQFAHVAGAQSPTAAPTAALFDEIEQRVTALRSRVVPEASQALGIALDYLRTLRESDGRLRTLVAAGEQVMALDLSLGEIRETTANLAGQVGQARESEAKVAERRLGALRLVEAYFLVGALGVGLLALILLFPGRGAAPVAAPAVPEPNAEAEPAGSLGLRPSRPESAPRVRPSAAAPPAPLPSTTALWQTARLCGELARLSNPGDLPALLARAAALLDAGGLVVWVADTAERSLHPASAHGYSQDALGRIGSIPFDADNATAAAFRTGELQVVGAEAASPGALVAPLVAPGGSVGVVAAEVGTGREADPDVQARAMIIASQLSTLVQPATPAHP